jgi:hypothetical protein
MKAFEHSQRVEPMLFIAIYYINIKMWILAYTYLKLACNLPYPKEAILFVNKNDYDYKRWHLMGIVAYYVGQYVDGKNACLIAIEYCKTSNDVRNNHDLDEKNLKFYLEKEQEQQQHQVVQRPTLHPEANTRKQFVDQKILEIQQTNPNLTPKQVFTRANMLWKNSRK